MVCLHCSNSSHQGMLLLTFKIAMLKRVHSLLFYFMLPSRVCVHHERVATPLTTIKHWLCCEESVVTPMCCRKHWWIPSETNTIARSNSKFFVPNQLINSLRSTPVPCRLQQRVKGCHSLVIQQINLLEQGGKPMIKERNAPELNQQDHLHFI